jgi:uncharacterized protein YndB with AHSA1/START domain
MENKVQHGYLVLADISGYTHYLAGVELDHAHEILSDLLETIVASLKSLLTIGKLEGDAVFAYVPEARVGRGETLLELVEATYLAFRDRLEGIRRRTTCTCNACRAIPSLDLKFITHHGDFMLQSISGITELVGSDVNLVHRLLKNHVAEATGWRAYALFTGPVLEHLVVPCDPRDLHYQAEAYEHLGEVPTYSLDLHKRYQALIGARHVVVSDAEADEVLDHAFPVPPAVVWDWLNDPSRRELWMPETRWSAAERPGGRTGPGASNHCAHGKNEVQIETILDWKPFEYFTVRHGREDDMHFVLTFGLTPLPDGRSTRLHTTLRGAMPKLPRPLQRPAARFMLKLMNYGKYFGKLQALVASASAEMAVSDAGLPAPAAA